MWGGERSQIGEGGARDITIPDLKLYYGVIVIKNGMVLEQNINRPMD